MDFLKNINKEFLLIKEFDFIEKEYHYLFKGEKINYGTVKVKVSDINMSKAKFYITEIGNIDDIVTQVADIMSKNLVKDAEKFKTIAQKVVKAWEDSPEEFKRQKDGISKVTFKRKGLLNDDEYMLSVFAHLGKISYHSGFGFTTGCGGDTFYDKDFYIKCLREIDGWIANTTKELNSAKVKARIKNQLLKCNITIPISKIDESLELAESATPKTNKPPFPVKFTADEMNSFMCNFSNAYIDSDAVEEFDEEYDIDISELLDWEVSSETDGYHHNDGQICDYTVTFTSPEGHEYYAYNSHCLMTGWNFYGDVEII